MSQELQTLLDELQLSTSIHPSDIDLTSNGSENETGSSPTDDSSVSLSITTSEDTDFDKSLWGLEPSRRRFAPPSRHHGHSSMVEKQLALAELQIENLKKDHSAKVSHLENQLRELQHDKHILQLRFEQETRRVREEVREEQLQTRRDLEELRQLQTRIETESPLLKERIDQTKQQLKELVVSEPFYLELRRIPEEQRTLRDWVWVKVYDLVSGYKSTIDKQVKEMETIRENLSLTTDQLERRNRELNHSKKNFAEREEDTKRRLDSVESRNRQLEAECKEANRLIAEQQRKAAKYDELYSQFRKLEDAHNSLLEQNTLQTVTLKSMSEEKDELRRAIENKSRQLDILSTDKTYLSKDNESLQDRLKLAHQQVERAESKLEDTKRAKKEYLSKLLSMKEEQKVGFEQRFQSELQKLQDKAQADLESIRANLNEVHERELRHLREGRDSLVNENERLAQKLRDKESAYEQLLLEFRTMQSRLENEIVELRSESKLKAFHVERASLTYEEAMNNLRHSKAEAETYKQKIELLKSEYYKMENELRNQVSEHMASLSVLKERLANYEAIEKELDSAILAAGDEVESASSKMEGADQTFLTALGATMAGAPTSAKRRIHQSLLLAQRLQTKQQEIDTLKATLSIEQEKVSRIQEDLQSTTALLDKTQQPYSYLVATIQDKEKESAELRRKLETAERKVQEMEKEHQQLARAKNQLQVDLDYVLNQRRQIESLRALVMKLLRQYGIQLSSDDLATLHAELHMTSLSTPHAVDLEGIGSGKQSSGPSTRVPAWFHKLKRQT